LDGLLHKSSFNVTVLSRENSTSTFPSGVTVIHANYDSPQSLKEAFEGQDVVISLIASAVLGDQTKFIDAAIAAGVQRFLPSEFGSDTADPKTRAIVAISQTKYDIVNYLKSKESELSWTSIISGPFFDWCMRVGFHGFDFNKKTATIFDNGTGRFSTSNLHTVALTVVKALENPELTKNQYVYVSGLETTQNEILAAVEKVTGEKWAIVQATTKELAEWGRAKLEKGDYMGILDLLRCVTFGAEQELGLFEQGRLWNERLGIPKDDLEKSVGAAFAGKLAHEV
jgi:hypothetical protein